MSVLSRESRKALENVVLAARGEAEAGARKALSRLAVAQREPPKLTAQEQSLRRRLRARGRQLGDRVDESGTQAVDHLVAQCAYEQWHRMLFARFLAESGLLIEPASGVPVSIEECKELARESGVDWILLASAFAQSMLPQIFSADDAVLEIALPAEHRQPIEQLLMSLPSELFLADDSLGWVYQFWQSKEKDRVNRSEEKIGADELPAVTQLFTEDYMVDFLLDNTLGAWHSAKVLDARSALAEAAQNEEELRSAVALTGCLWKYLRFIRADDGKWAPAAGTFVGWPKMAKALKCLDPCMGSGHFVVAMFKRLVALRMAEEQLDEMAAVVAVIRDNLFGLEIDPRCTQIAAFNLALAAWRRVGHCKLPPMNLASSGLAPNSKEDDWLRLAGDNEKLRLGMKRLHRLFKDAPVLGSLINPRARESDLLEAAFHELQPLLEKALAQEIKDDAAHEMAVTARGLAKAAEILAGQFTLVATNVPYLGRGKQDDQLKDYCERVHFEAKADLATCFVERSINLCEPVGCTALVTPQNWWFLGTYRAFRERMLSTHRLNFIVTLGEEAWQSFGDRGPMAGLMVVDRAPAIASHRIAGIDALPLKTVAEKRFEIETGKVRLLVQTDQYASADHRLTVDQPPSGPLLQRYATCSQGIGTADANRYIAKFWEVTSSDVWEFYQMAPVDNILISGCHSVVRWERGNGSLATSPQARVCGQPAWGKRGVAVAVTRDLCRALYLGGKFDCTLGALVASADRSATEVSAFVLSDEFLPLVRQIDKALSVTESSLLKVPFDFARWQKVAAEKYPGGLPKPFSNDPTQWLFNGHPKGSDQPLHVAVARLLGYLWPRQTGSSFPDCPALEPDGLETLADDDGIVCLSATKGEAPAAERLRGLLASIWDKNWNASVLEDLLAQQGYAGRTLDEWLRDGFFEQHCELFEQRPFIWHVWDGRRDGFGALVNYHKLTKANLEKLTYAYLGDWIGRQQAAVGAGESGSDARLVAAKQLQEELKKILGGDPPYDVFVRWKPIAHQPIGWEPDLNDGVRINIRPFMQATDVGKKGAGILRIKPGIKWDKDRGKELSRSKDEFPWFWGWDAKTRDFAGGPSFDGNRWNDLHYSREFKMAARRQKGLA